MDSRAAAITADIKKTGGTKVLVYDFSGPTGLTALGIELADEFSESIARAWSENMRTASFREKSWLDSFPPTILFQAN
ncbi:MAG TPA: hypothetical protein VIY69_02115 [Candidatus Acidoferrales bacterium]